MGGSTTKQMSFDVLHLHCWPNPSLNFLRSRSNQKSTGTKPWGIWEMPINQVPKPNYGICVAKSGIPANRCGSSECNLRPRKSFQKLKIHPWKLRPESAPAPAPAAPAIPAPVAPVAPEAPVPPAAPALPTPAPVSAVAAAPRPKVKESGLARGFFNKAPKKAGGKPISDGETGNQWQQQV